MRVLFTILDTGRPTHEILNTTFCLVEYALNARVAKKHCNFIENGTLSTSPHIGALSGHHSGTWERLVRNVLRVPNITFGLRRLAYEFLNATLCLVEYTLNAQAGKELRNLLKNRTRSTWPNIWALRGSVSSVRHTTVESWRRCSVFL